LKPRWNAGISERQQKALKESFLGSGLMRERLVSMLKEDIDKSLRSMRNATTREHSNLTEFYVQELARQSTLEDVIKLIKEK